MLTKPHKNVSLSESIKEDLRFWENYLEFYNGINLLKLLASHTSSSLHMFTDSSKFGYERLSIEISHTVLTVRTRYSSFKILPNFLIGTYVRK